MVHVERDEVILTPVQQTQLMATMDANRGSTSLSDADACRIGKAMANNMRFETTVTNKQQQIIIDGALNPIGGKPLTA